MTERAKCPECGIPTVPNHENLGYDEMLCEPCYGRLMGENKPQGEMKTFYVLETQACFVTWRNPVRARTREEAAEKFRNGEHGEAIGGPEIGDSIDYIECELKVEEES